MHFKRGHFEIQKGPVRVKWGQYPQGALAADAGIYQELVSRIENGAANPELDTLGKLVDALGVQPRDLFEE
jgi:predicted transcriptional regulator